MGVRVSVTIRGPREHLVPEQVLRNEAELLVQRIKTRTKSGISSTGTRFVPYTPAYAELKGVGPSRVTLRRTGEMLDDLDVLSVSNNRIKIGFRSRDMADRAAYNEERRPFLNPAPDWIEKLVRGISASLNL